MCGRCTDCVKASLSLCKLLSALVVWLVVSVPPETRVMDSAAGTQLYCRYVVAALAVWKLSQFLWECCHSGCLVAFLAVVHISNSEV